MSASLTSNPHPSQWLDFTANRILLKSGKVEIGQGIGTALIQIAADELQVDPDMIELVAGRTNTCPDEFWTSASISIEAGGSAVRTVCAAARHRFTAAAALRLNVTLADIELRCGVFTAPAASRELTYADLVDDIDLDEPPTATEMPINRAHHQHVGRSLPRRDLNTKLIAAAFIHDIDRPGMVHGRVVLPPRAGASLEILDVDSIRMMPGVIDVVVDGSFVAIAAVREEQAIAAQAKAEAIATWSGEYLPRTETANDFLETFDATYAAVAGNPQVSAGTTLTFTRPFIAHASIGLCCALAEFDLGRLTVWTHSQGVFPLRRALAQVLETDPTQIDVVHAPGAGCYGHNGADDVALDAVLLARAVGRPVRMVWTRAQELQSAPAGPAMSATLTANVANGRISSWRHSVKGFTHLTRPGWGEGVNLASAWRLSVPHAPSPIADPPQVPFGGGGCRNAPPIYDVPAFVEYGLITESPFRTSAVRALGAHLNVFAIESMMDELAELADVDPVAFRLAHLTDERAKAVLSHVAKMASWPRRNEDGSVGFGVGLARYKNTGGYCAVIVELGFEDKLKPLKAWAVVDPGLAINPDGIINQIEGGIVQALSLTLKEELKWDEIGFQAASWDQYPIIGFNEIPEIFVELLSNPDHPSLGVGECATGPTAAAVGNAVKQALGVRICHMPISAERIAAALA